MVYSELQHLVIVVCVVLGLLMALINLVDAHRVRRARRAAKVSVTAKTVEPVVEDDLLFTHAQVVDELSPEVREALFGAPVRPVSVSTESVVWWRGAEHRLRTEVLDGPIGDPDWVVLVGTCSGCDWRFSARESVVLERFGTHAEELVPTGHRIEQARLQTERGRVVKIYCSCGWYEHLTSRSTLTPDQRATEHLREAAARELEVKIKGHERWATQLARALQLPVSTEPAASVVPLLLRTNRPDQVRYVQFCSHEDTIELRSADGWRRELCTKCGAETTSRLGVPARLARPTRPSPTTGERRG